MNDNKKLSKVTVQVDIYMDTDHIKKNKSRVVEEVKTQLFVAGYDIRAAEIIRIKHERK